MPAAYLRAPDFFLYQRCTKIPLPNRRAALTTLRSIGKRKGDVPVQRGIGELNVYRCRICGKLHIGHRPPG